MYKPGDKVKLISNLSGANWGPDYEDIPIGTILEVKTVDLKAETIVVEVEFEKNDFQKQYLLFSDIELYNESSIQKKCSCTMNQLLLGGCKCGGV